MSVAGRLQALLPVLIAVSLTAQKSPVPTVWDDSEFADWPAPIGGLNIHPGLFTQRDYYAVVGQLPDVSCLSPGPRASRLLADA